MTKNTQRFCLVAAGLLGAMAIALGAFHAHGLESWLGRYGLPSVFSSRLISHVEMTRFQTLLILEERHRAKRMATPGMENGACSFAYDTL